MAKQEKLSATEKEFKKLIDDCAKDYDEKPVGRKSDFPENAFRVVQYILAGNDIKSACALSDVGRTTYHDWKSAYPKFPSILRKAMMHWKAVRIVRIQNAGKKFWKADAWLLERMFPNDFALKSILETQEDTGEDPAQLLLEKLVDKAKAKARGDETKPEEEKEVEEEAREIPRFE